MLTPVELASRIEHANLAPNATRARIEKLCEDARERGFAAVCIHPTRVAQAVGVLVGTPIAVCAVVGFPSGAHASAIKVSEATLCVAEGATAIDVVANSGLLIDGAAIDYADEISRVRQAIGDKVILKVIIEAPLLSPDQITQAAHIAVESGADYIKTSTGVYTKARREDVCLLRSVLPPGVKIKAAGGIKSAACACELIAAGADRIGTSSSLAIMEEAEQAASR